MKTLRIKPNPLFTLCVLLVINSISYAQDYNTPPPPPPDYRPTYNQAGQDKDYTEPSGYSSINFGFANPIGSFASPTGSRYGGYAVPGYVFHFSLGIPIDHSNFGIAAMFGDYNNNYDLNSYAANNGESPLYPDQNYYSQSSFMAGLYITIPVGRLSIDGRVMLGALVSTLPEQDYGYMDASENQYEFDMQPSNTTNLAYDAGIGLRYLIVDFRRRSLCAMVNADFLYANANYSTEQIEYYTPSINPTNVTYETDTPVNGHLNVELINITFGLGYQF